ncbi:hypothetical protein F4778DRAFT_770636 [Xylariomycetidae sp. FL2044]|nr:hypothetical protein F4778DRAFT_770636 [Xylariomycetidae sp. FL2044]
MAVYDEFAEANADDGCRTWLHQLIDAEDDVVAFIDARLDGKGTGEYLGFFKGSFNLSYHIGFRGHRPGVLIRFAKPGYTHTPSRAKKFTKCHATIPLPCIRCWGLAEESLRQLGPSIIMNFIDGVRLSTFIKQPTEEEVADPILNPDIEEETLDTIYNQLAKYVLQLSQLDFPLIGAISQDVSEIWAVTSRPLTYDMNELATGTGYPTNELPAVPFHRASDYFQSVSNQRLLHLQTQQNLARDEADVRRLFVARHRFKQLVPEYFIDDAGPFKLFCDDMRPANMMIDLSTLRLTAGFTNSMPAQFTYDPPWWLLLKAPAVWLDRVSMNEFYAQYVPRMELFLRALEQPRLSTRMRDSWKTGRFWFNSAARACLDMDDIYIGVLCMTMCTATREELEPLVLMKMNQREAYKKERAVRLKDD